MADYLVNLNIKIAVTASNEEIAKHRCDLLCQAALKGLDRVKRYRMGDVLAFTAEVEKAQE